MKICTRLACLALSSALICLALTGCWNYRRINELTIVAGIAIDRPDSGDGFKVSFETIDFSKSLSENTVSTKIISSEGNTIFDAFNKTKDNAVSDLYFANMQLICLSEQIVKDEGLVNITDGIMRDSDIRESVCIIIAQGTSAYRIITPDEGESRIVSYEISDLVDDAADKTSAHKIGVYRTYNQIKDGLCFTLPAFSIDEGKTAISGMTVFSGDNMLGFIDYDNIAFYQFASNNFRTGIFSFPLTDNNIFDCSINILDSNTKISYDKRDDGTLSFHIAVKTKGAVKEIMDDFDILNDDNREYFRQRFSEYVCGGVYNFVNMMRCERGIDILNFENLIYRSDRGYYGQIADRCRDMVMNAEVSVSAELVLTNSGFIN